MNILMLTDFYPPIVGGVEQHVRNLSAELVARGHSVAVATLWHEGTAEFEIDERGVRIYRVRGTVQRAVKLFSDAGRRYAPPIPDPEVVMALRRVIKQERPSIVHAHNWFVHSFLPLKAWSKARLVVSLHEYSLACPKKSLMHHDSLCSGPGVFKCLECAGSHYGLAKGVPTVLSNWVMGAAEKAAVDMFLPVSEAVARGNGLTGSKLPYQVVPNFVPDKVGTPEGEAGSIVDDLPSGDFLLFVGALGLHKGVAVLLKAYSEMDGAPPLVLIGADWPDTPTHFPPNVRVLKNWPHRAVMEAWRRSTIALAPSIWPEPCPTVVMEAMSIGRPVIATDIGGLPDIIGDGETGLLVPPGDVAALRGAMERLLADPELRMRMGEAGKRKVTEFYASTVVQRIEHVYRGLRRGRAAEKGLKVLARRAD